MGELTRAETKEVVRKALQKVAGFPGDFEEFTFNRFLKYHKIVFLEGLKNELNQVRPDDDHYYDVELDQNSISLWPTLRDCVDWVFQQRRLRRLRSAPLTREDLVR